MSLIVAVKSCFRDLNSGCHDEIRMTWGQALRGQAQVKFFLGRPTKSIGGMPSSVDTTADNSYSPKSDEIILDVPDDYESLVFKTRAITKWFSDKAATHILLTDVDTIVFPKRLWNFNYSRVDYAGNFNGGFGEIKDRMIVGPGGASVQVKDVHSWASGAGYILSKQAANIIADTFPQQTRYIVGSNEDYWVGQILGPHVQRGDLWSEQPEKRLVLYYVDKDGHSKGYDPRTNKWVRFQWQRYLKGEVGQ
jgi:Galactosyltransferase